MRVPSISGPVKCFLVVFFFFDGACALDGVNLVVSYYYLRYYHFYICENMFFKVKAPGYEYIYIYGVNVTIIEFINFFSP